MSRSGDAVLAALSAGDHPLLEAFPRGAVFAFDADLRYLCAGGLGLREAGMSPEDLVGRTLSEVFDPASCAVVEPLYRAALAGEATVRDVAYDGRTYSQSLAPVCDDAGEVVAGVGFSQDVSEARGTQQKVRESEQRTRLTFEHAPIGQAIVELDGRWRQVNAALCRLLGYSREELLAMTFQDITHPDDLDLDLGHLTRLVAGELPSYQMEKRYFTAAGAVVWVSLSVAVVREVDGTPLYLVSQIEDITERKRQQQALRDVADMLSHDLRSPATVVGGLAELLLEHDLDKSERRRYLERIRSAATSMTALLENALAAATHEVGELYGAPQAVDVGAAAAAAVRDLGPGTTAQVDLEVGGRCRAWVDPVHLSQVLGNLLGNAVKYGGGRIRVRAREDGDSVLLGVGDDGPGVEAEFVPQLFERGTRSPSARRSGRQGSGLGLHIVARLVTANHGRVDYATSSLGGAELVVRLPRATAPPE